MSQSFPYERDIRFAPLWLPWVIGPAEHGITLTDDAELVARFGVLRLATPRSNVAGAHLTGPYRWWTAIGPRLSLVDDGLTFGTTNRGGVCIHFRRPVGPVLGLRPHSALTVTVADGDGLVRALTGQP